MLKKTKFSLFKNHFPICVFSLGLVFFIFLTCSVNAKADGLSYTLPYNVYEYKDLNSLFWQFDLQQAIINKVSDYNNNANVDVDLDNFFMFTNQIYTYSDHTRFYVRVISGATATVPSDYASIVANKIRFTQVVNGGSCNIVVDYYNNGSYVLDFGGYFNANQYFDIFGTANTVDFQGFKYTLNYPFYSSPLISDSNDVPVLVLDLGDPVPEYENLDEFLDITSTISNGIDDSLSDLQNQQGFFNNLISNLKNFFNALKGWLYSGFNNLSLNIKNFFGPFLTNFLNKINEFFESFEDLKDKFSHFFEIIGSIYNLALENGEFSLPKLISVLLVPSQEDISSAFSGTVFYTLYTGVNTSSKYLYTYFTTLFSSTPNTFVMTLPTFTFGGKEFRGLQISFDWFIPYKTYFDIIVSGFLIMGYIRFLAMWINNFFHGSGFIDHDVNNISARSDSL